MIERGRPADLVGFRVQGEFLDWFGIPFEPERSEVDFVMINGKKMF